jgi:hypothetical protein
MMISRRVPSQAGAAGFDSRGEEFSARPALVFRAQAYFLPAVRADDFFSRLHQIQAAIAAARQE